MSNSDRKICFECGLDIGTSTKPFTENMAVETVVGGFITVYLCSQDCRDQHLLITKESPSQMYH